MLIISYGVRSVENLLRELMSVRRPRLPLPKLHLFPLSHFAPRPQCHGSNLFPNSNPILGSLDKMYHIDGFAADYTARTLDCDLPKSLLAEVGVYTPVARH